MAFAFKQAQNLQFNDIQYDQVWKKCDFDYF